MKSAHQRMQSSNVILCPVVEFVKILLKAKYLKNGESHPYCSLE
jgi:hypothetical protein